MLIGVNCYELGFIDYAVNKMIVNSLSRCIFYDDTNKYIKKIKIGIVFYKKKRNGQIIEYKKPRFDRRIMTMRIFTHTTK